MVYEDLLPALEAGKVDMVLIEVQTGTYLGEDDIIRYEDVYARGQGAKG